MDCEGAILDEIVIRFAYADAGAAQVHYAHAGAGPLVLCLHQSPRSWDEYREVIPVLARHFHVVAMDTPGMGNSPPWPGGASIEHYAEAALAVIRDAGGGPVALVGHHTGGVIAVRAAAELGVQVNCLVLSSTPLLDTEARRLREHRPHIDAVESRDDGAHLQAIWDRRAGFYPADRPDIRRRYVLDALRAVDPEEGHRAVAAYHMERDLPRVVAPARVVHHAADPYAGPEAPRLAAALADAELLSIEHGMVPLEYAAEAFAKLALEFLLRHHVSG